MFDRHVLTLELMDPIFDEMIVEYSSGMRRGAQAIPLLIEKFKLNLLRRFSPARQAEIPTVSLDQAVLEAMPGHQFYDLYVIQYFPSDFNAAIGSAATDTEICRRVFFMFDNWRGHEFFGIL